MSNTESNKLLMMFIADAFSSSGTISKKTAIAMMTYVASDRELQNLINYSDANKIRKHQPDNWIPLDDKSRLFHGKQYQIQLTDDRVCCGILNKSLGGNGSWGWFEWGKDCIATIDDVKYYQPLPEAKT